MSTPSTVHSRRHAEAGKTKSQSEGTRSRPKKPPCSALRLLGGVNAACCQLVRGFPVSPLNQQKLFDTDGVKVAREFVQCLGETKWLGTSAEKELERLFRFVLAQTTQMRFSLEGGYPEEPWITDFCDAVRSHLAKAGMEGVAQRINLIAANCLVRVDKQKVAAVEEKSKATRKRKEAAKEAAAERYGPLVDCGPHKMPDSRSSVARAAGFEFDDFGEDGELLPDSDCDDDDNDDYDCAWHRKRRRYCELMAQKGQAMDLKGRNSAAVHGARLVVYYDEDGSDKHNVPYPATAIEVAESHDFMWVKFANGEDVPVNDDDDWHWA